MITARANVHSVRCRHNARMKPLSMISTFLRPLAAGCILLLTGCATLDGPPDPNDPWERFNRSMYSFNTTVDKAVLKPTAKAYRAITPDPVETGVINFFSNLDDVRIMVNNLLQFKLLNSLSDGGRLLINSTLGLGGLFDVATHIGLQKHEEDFGQTLGYWGLDSGPYLVLPFFGPSTVRDGAGLPADMALNPVREVDDEATRNGLYILDAVSTRADLLRASTILEEAAYDEYSYLRDAFLQRRRSQVHDGNPPAESTDEEIDIFAE
jgi:phospholipid-binding lipoprotein MlaA